MTIALAEAEDIPAVTALWNDVIRDTTITFTTEPKTEAGIAELMTRQPLFVARRGGACVGFASYFAFRAGPGYAGTAEHAIYLAPGARGSGLGRALMDRVEAHARDAGRHLLVAGISGENAPAVTFHERMGFALSGRIPGAGAKFGRQIDLILMHKAL